MNATVRALVLALFLVSLSSPATAHSVGQVDTSVYFDAPTFALLAARGGGVMVGDELGYIVEFMPVANGATVGAGGWITAYVPTGTEVIGAEHVRNNGAGFEVTAPAIAGDTWTGTGGNSHSYAGYTTMHAATIAACTTAGFTIETCNGRMMQVYADTGVFYSTSAATALFVGPDTDGIMRSTNGYHVDPSAEGQLTGILGIAAARTHNLWDASQTNAFGGDIPNAMPRSNAASYAQRGTVPFNAGSPVAGPDSGYQLDNLGQIGPWRRIAHVGSTIGSVAGGPTDQKGVVGVYGDPTTAGWNLSAANPLPAGTNTVRYAVGQIVHGETRYVRLRLRVTAVQPGFGLPLATEVFGGDSANAGGKDNKDNPWRYHVPSIAMLQDSPLYLSVTIAAVNGVPYAGGRIPSDAVVTYRISYANLGDVALNGAQVSVDLPPETQNCPVDETSFTVISGPNILPHTPTCAGGLGRGGVVGFQTVTLGAGEFGVVEFDMRSNSSDADLIVTEAILSSTDVPLPVRARSQYTVGDEAFLAASVAVNPQTVPPTRTVTYAITVTNNGGAAATAIDVNFVLPGVGSAVNERLDYVNMSSVVTGFANIAPVATTPSAIAPFSAQNRQELFWDFGNASLAAGASFTIEIMATVGANVPVSPPDYFSGLVITYDDGSIADDRLWLGAVAPVTVGVLDTDGDTVPDDIDVDDDGDGIPDLMELPPAFGTDDPGADADMDGVPNYRDPDFLLAANLQPEDLDADGDGIPNHLDRDSDGDGITDAWEADGSDLDGDGLRDGCFPAAADGECAGGPATPRNTDADVPAVPDYLDLDSDGDGVMDSVEGHDVDGDGIADTIAAGSDRDGDGIDDAFDPDCALPSDCGGIIGAPAPLPDSNGIGEPNVLEVCGDGYVAAFEACDDGDADDTNACSNACLLNLDQPCSTDPNCVSGICNMTLGICALCENDSPGVLTDTGCSAGLPVCDETASPICGACADDTAGGTDSGCLASAPACDSSGAASVCVTCEDNVAAGADNGCNVASPVCDASGAAPICVECLGNADCPGAFCSATNTCVECLLDADCPGASVCGPANICVSTCFSNTDCTNPATPVCEVAQGVCVACLGDSDCPATAQCSLTRCIPFDSDGDGSPDEVDLDDDNDGIPDLAEFARPFPTDPSADDDNDGLLNWQDPDYLAAAGLTAADVDFDGDGIPNHLDVDADGDGITDLVEGGGTDSNGDGLVDGFVDANSDGLDDAIAATPLDLPDSDLDMAPDFLDLDSDDDGLADAVEGHDANHDGVADVLASGVDTDGDGLDDAYDGSCRRIGDCGAVIGVVAPTPDLDQDGAANYRDSDDDEDGRSTADERADAAAYTGPAADPSDVDGDGLPNWYDVDSDDDGLTDAMETAMGLDGDGNGIPDYLDPLDPLVPGDSDLDGIPDSDECPPPGSVANGTCRDSDGDGTPDYLDVDDDNDGILTRDEFLRHGPEQNPVADMDWDNDGVPNHLDLDSDNDGIPDITENGNGALDADGDGRVDDALDSDGDGLAAVFDPDDSDATSFARGPLRDTDNDGKPDAYDRDADGDGIPDTLEAGAIDANGDGVVDDTADADGDGLVDSADPDAAGGLPIPDTDRDGDPDFQDTDSDNDGVPDRFEGHAAGTVGAGIDADGDGLDDVFDPTAGGTPATLPDTDGDGTPDWRDRDDDGDGVPTSQENPDPDGDGDPSDAQDTDGDGTPDYLDPDDDGDGILTRFENPNPDGDDTTDDAIDTDGNGVPDYLDLDDDGDGVHTRFEQPDPNGDGDPSDARDTDGDGIPDYLDPDDDGDGVPTIDEGADPNGDGNPDDATDSDGDGIPDYLEDDADLAGQYTLSGGCDGCSAAGTRSADPSWLVLGLLGAFRLRRRRR